MDADLICSTDTSGVFAVRSSHAWAGFSALTHMGRNALYCITALVNGVGISEGFKTSGKTYRRTSTTEFYQL